MTFSIGRQTLSDPVTWPTSGKSIALSGDYNPSSVATGAIARENLRWMEGTIQPVVWTEDTTKSGFYRVAGVTTADTEVTLSTGFFRWSVDLEPIPHHRAAEIEASCKGADRTNEPGGGVTPVPWYAIPNEAVAVNYGTGSITTDSRIGPGGTALVMTGAGFYDRYARWTVSAANFLNMAPRVQFGGVTVVGNQSTLTPFDCTLDNGIVKIGQATGSDSFTVTLPAATASSWGTPFGLKVGYWDGVSALTAFDPDDFYAARITRNDPQVCAVRWSYETAGYIAHVDISLRRGAAWADIVISQESAYTNQKFGVEQSSCTTVHTSRTLRSGPTEDNYRFLLSDPDAQQPGSGVMYATVASDQSRFGIGVILEGGSATSENDTASVRDQFFAAQQITERFSGVRQ